MLRVTVWYCQNKDSSWSHNHIEDGWVIDLDRPYSTNKKQAISWNNKKWKAVYAFKTTNGLVSEKAACIAAIKMSSTYNYVPTDKFVEELERGVIR